MNYTKGDRKVYKVGAFYLVNTDNMKNIATCKTEADAYLDAAAPEIYKRLGETTALLQALMTKYRLDGVMGSLTRTIKYNQQALAKAEGIEGREK